MDYETAKAIVMEAGLIIDAAPPGQLHIDVRRDMTGPHHSIMLPARDGDEGRDELIASLVEAYKHLPPLP